MKVKLNILFKGVSSGLRHLQHLFTCGEADRSSRGRFIFPNLLRLRYFKKLGCLWADLADT